MSGGYQTDDHLQSRALSIGTNVTPVTSLWGNIHNPGKLAGADEPGGHLLQFTWTATSDADYSKVYSPWLIKTLKTTPQYGRLGFDLNSTLSFAPDGQKSSWTLAFENDYSRRYALTSQGGTVGLYTSKLTLSAPSQGSLPTLGIGLVYENGHDLISLAPLNQLTVSLSLQK